VSERGAHRSPRLRHAHVCLQASGPVCREAVVCAQCACRRPADGMRARCVRGASAVRSSACVRGFACSSCAGAGRLQDLCRRAGTPAEAVRQPLRRQPALSVARRLFVSRPGEPAQLPTPVCAVLRVQSTVRHEQERNWPSRSEPIQADATRGRLRAAAPQQMPCAAVLCPPLSLSSRRHRGS